MWCESHIGCVISGMGWTWPMCSVPGVTLSSVINAMHETDSDCYLCAAVGWGCVLARTASSARCVCPGVHVEKGTCSRPAGHANIYLLWPYSLLHGLSLFAPSSCRDGLSDRNVTMHACGCGCGRQVLPHQWARLLRLGQLETRKRQVCAWVAHTGACDDSWCAMWCCSAVVAAAQRTLVAAVQK